MPARTTVNRRNSTRVERILVVTKGPEEGAIVSTLITEGLRRTASAEQQVSCTCRLRKVSERL